MRRAYFDQTIEWFLQAPAETVLGQLLQRSAFAVEPTQRDAWITQITILKSALAEYGGRGKIYFEYDVPRLGRRIDAIVLIGPVIFVMEFKVGERKFTAHALDQVYDYALDLKNFHEASHTQYIAPILIPTKARKADPIIGTTPKADRLLLPITSTPQLLANVIREVLAFVDGPDIDPNIWEEGRYRPTPTIIEAATALYRGHTVEDIARRDADAMNLSQTTHAVSDIIRECRAKSLKSICFVTGVPGAGKTLVGLTIATQHFDKESDSYSVFLSGNGPLVAILREALARDKVSRERERGVTVRLEEARTNVKAFIQNVHNFRDECLVDLDRPPIEHVALFDEAQRAWNLDQTAKFMLRKKKYPNFTHSEPEFLISCLDRHKDWAVIVCLVGGGQEINTGEAGIAEWIDSVIRSFPDWHLHISSRLTDSEYAAGHALERIQQLPNITFRDQLHLSVSMRSFRAERVSLLIKQLLDLDEGAAAQTLVQISERYPIVLTRTLQKAKQWLRDQARGTERYGIVVSSHAKRLKPHAIDVRYDINPIHWFLNSKKDVRSSYYLEDVATQFDIQGLELDWVCLTWDADFRHSYNGWQHWYFAGQRWKHMKRSERKAYLKNAYRVLLTRARQGMVIVVPEGDAADPTRDKAFYDPTFEYLRRIGFTLL